MFNEVDTHQGDPPIPSPSLSYCTLSQFANQLSGRQGRWVEERLACLWELGAEWWASGCPFLLEGLLGGGEACFLAACQTLTVYEGVLCLEVVS